MKYELRWSQWNIDHIAKHDVTPAEAQYIVDHARPPYPQRQGEKYLVIGQLWDGTHLQVIFVEDRFEEDAFYVIHARALTDVEKRRFRRRKK